MEIRGLLWQKGNPCGKRGLNGKKGMLIENTGCSWKSGDSCGKKGVLIENRGILMKNRKSLWKTRYLYGKRGLLLQNMGFSWKTEDAYGEQGHPHGKPLCWGP